MRAFRGAHVGTPRGGHTLVHLGGLTWGYPSQYIRKYIPKYITRELFSYVFFLVGRYVGDG